MYFVQWFFIIILLLNNWYINVLISWYSHSIFILSHKKRKDEKSIKVLSSHILLKWKNNTLRQTRLYDVVISVPQALAQHVINKRILKATWLFTKCLTRFLKHFLTIPFLHLSSNIYMLTLSTCGHGEMVGTFYTY